MSGPKPTLTDVSRTETAIHLTMLDPTDSTFTRWGSALTATL